MVGIMASFVPLIAAARAGESAKTSCMCTQVFFAGGRDWNMTLRGLVPAGAEGTAVAAFDQYVDAANDFVFCESVASFPTPSAAPR